MRVATSEDWREYDAAVTGFPPWFAWAVDGAANPTANGIHERLGFRPVGSIVEATLRAG